MRFSTLQPRWRPLTLALFISTQLAQAASHTAPPSSPYAPLPLAVSQTKTKIISNKGSVKPNVLFLIDDTGSMSERVPGTNETREDVVQGAISALVNKQKNSINYYLLDLCGTSQQKPKVGAPLNSRDFLAYIRGMIANCGEMTDHSIEGYYDAIYFMRKNMNEASGLYRCQKNIIIYFGDGESNPTQVEWNDHGVATAVGDSMLTMSGNRIYGTLYTRWNAQAAHAGSHMMSWFSDRYDQYGNFWDCTGREYTTRPLVQKYWQDGEGCRYQDRPDWGIYAKFGDAPRSFHRPEDTVRTEDPFGWIGGSGHYYENYVGEDVLGGPADWIKSHDLVKATPSRPNDAAGKSWDDPNYPKQTIDTFAVGLGVQNGSYLDGASASAPKHKSILAQNQEELLQAFDRIFEKIHATASLDLPSSYSYTSPATLGDTRLSDAVGVHILEGLKRGQLRFFAFDESQGNFGDTPDGTPSFYGQSLPPQTPERPILAHAKARNFYLNDAQNLSNRDFDLPGNTQEWKKFLIPWLVMTANPSEQDDQNLNARFAASGYPRPNNLDPKSPRYRIRKDKVNGENTRGYFMGDVIDSPVVPGGMPIAGRAGIMQQFLVTSANDGMTYIFERNAQNKDDKGHPYDLRLRYLPLDMDREPGDTIGKQLSIISRGDYAEVSSPYPHEWLNDGGITIRSIISRKGPGQQSFALVSPGQGARGIYALNLGGKDFFSGAPAGLDGDQWLHTVPLFQTPSGAQNQLGYIMGNPSIARLAPCRGNDHVPSGQPLSYAHGFLCSGTAAKTPDSLNRGVVYAAVYGSGYDAPAGARPAVYVDLLTPYDYGAQSTGQTILGATAGLHLQVIPLPRDAGGVSAPTVVDMDFDGVADLIYVGTQKGGLYRIDLRGRDPATWQAQKIFQTPTVPEKVLANDPVGLIQQGKSPIIITGQPKAQPISSAPDVFRTEVYKNNQKHVHYYVLFGTGSGIYQRDLYDRSQQALYSIEDDPDAPATVLSKDDLEVRTLGTKTSTQKGKVESLRTVLSPQKSANAPDKHGWYADLNAGDHWSANAGERVLSSPIVIKSSVIFSSVVYDPVASAHNESNAQDPCSVNRIDSSVGATGWVMIFNAKNGLAPGKQGVGIEGLNEQSNAAGTTNTPGATSEVGKKRENVTNLTLFTGATLNGQGQNSLTESGALVSGVDGDLTPGGATPANNTCMTPEQAEAWKIIGQNALGVNNDIKLRPALCEEGGLYRLNYRKIIL